MSPAPQRKWTVFLKQEWLSPLAITAADCIRFDDTVYFHTTLGGKGSDDRIVASVLVDQVVAVLAQESS